MAKKYDSAPELSSVSEAHKFVARSKSVGFFETSLADLRLYLKNNHGLHNIEDKNENMETYGEGAKTSYLPRETPYPLNCPSPRAQRLARREREGTLYEQHTSDTGNSLTLTPNMPKSASQTSLSTSTLADEKKLLQAWLVEHQQAHMDIHHSTEPMYDDTTTSDDVKQARALRRAIQSLQTWHRLEAHELRGLISCLGEKQIELQQAELRCLRRLDQLIYNMIGKRVLRWIVALLVCVIVLLLCITVMLFWIVCIRA